MALLVSCGQPDTSGHIRLQQDATAAQQDATTAQEDATTADASVDASTDAPVFVEQCGDGVDNDRDEAIDEGCVCVGTESRACYTGANTTRGVGACEDGTQTCMGNPSAWGECSGQTLPSPEMPGECDDVDNDCDRFVDEGTGAACCTTERIEAATVWEASVALSKHFFSDGAVTAVLFATKNDEYPSHHGILGGALAATLSAPALGTYHASEQSSVHPAIKAELARLSVRNVVIVGDEASLAPQAASELQSAGYDVERIAGTNTAETAALVAKKMTATADAVFLVNYEETSSRLTDAASVAGIAGRLRYPILFTSADALPSETSTALSSLRVTRTYVMGSASTISDGVSASVPGPVRFGGATRYDSAVSAATEAARLGVRSSEVMLIPGERPCDAMAAAAAGRIHLLVRGQAPFPDSVAAWLGEAAPERAYVIGATTALDSSIDTGFCAAAFP